MGHFIFIIKYKKYLFRGGYICGSPALVTTNLIFLESDEAGYNCRILLNSTIRIDNSLFTFLRFDKVLKDVFQDNKRLLNFIS